MSPVVASPEDDADELVPVDVVPVVSVDTLVVVDVPASVPVADADPVPVSMTSGSAKHDRATVANAIAANARVAGFTPRFYRSRPRTRLEVSPRLCQSPRSRPCRAPSHMRPP
jgi:hypothetical protein